MKSDCNIFPISCSISNLNEEKGNWQGKASYRHFHDEMIITDIMDNSIYLMAEEKFWIVTLLYCLINLYTLSFLIVCMYMNVWVWAWSMCALACMWVPKDNIWELTLSFYKGLWKLNRGHQASAHWAILLAPSSSLDTLRGALPGWA